MSAVAMALHAATVLAGGANTSHVVASEVTSQCPVHPGISSSPFRSLRLLLQIRIFSHLSSRPCRSTVVQAVDSFNVDLRKALPLSHITGSSFPRKYCRLSVLKSLFPRIPNSHRTEGISFVVHNRGVVVRGVHQFQLSPRILLKVI